MTIVGRAALVGWKKSMTSKASTYVVEIEQDSVWFGRLGSGGAFWQPDILQLGVASGRREFAHGDMGFLESRAYGRAAGKAGQAVSNVILGKFEQEIRETAERYDAGGRAAIPHKANMDVARAELASGTWVEKLPGGAPLALKQMDGPVLQANVSGKKWFFLGLPDALPIQEFHAALQA